ncbi:MAG TPA: hypothetical protein VFJ16_00770 [Longimicrobium sp.]|nr:hypothetical protein [Longimicrobium sp.]
MMVVTLAGVVTGTDLDAFSNTVKQDRAVDPTWPALVDASALNPGAITTEMLRERANRVRTNPVRVAIVASADAVFGLARMFQMMSEGRGNHIEVFRGRPEAMAWLMSGSGAA